MSQLVDMSVRSVRLFVAGMMALASALLFVALLFEDFSALAAADPSQVPWSLMLRYVVSMTFGGAIAGYLLSGMFGRSGIFGWFLALAGGVFTSIFAGILGSFVGRPLTDLRVHSEKRASQRATPALLTNHI